jgi:hypothetical protein
MLPTAPLHDAYNEVMLIRSKDQAHALIAHNMQRTGAAFSPTHSVGMVYAPYERRIVLFTDIEPLGTVEPAINDRFDRSHWNGVNGKLRHYNFVDSVEAGTFDLDKLVTLRGFDGKPARLCVRDGSKRFPSLEGTFGVSGALQIMTDIWNTLPSNFWPDIVLKENTPLTTLDIALGYMRLTMPKGTGNRRLGFEPK